MSIMENIKIALFSIRTNFLRSILTMLGIIIGVASVIAVITVGNGGKEFIVGLISGLSSNSINITVNANASADQKITRDDIEYIKKIDSVKHASPMIYKLGSLSGEKNKGLGLAIAGNTDLQYAMKVTMMKGRFFTKEEYDDVSYVCVIPEIGAMSLFGTTDVLGKNVIMALNGQNIKFKIVGISNTDMTSSNGNSSSTIENMQQVAQNSNNPQMASMGSFATILIPSTVTDAVSGTPGGAYDTLFLTTDEDSKVESMGNAAKNVLFSRHGNFGSDAYRVVNMQNFANIADKIINILTTFVAGVSAISLLVGGIGVMNIMLVSVTERTREIGIRKALGAKTSTILSQFLTESLILCLIGGIIGFILGVVLASIIASIAGIPIKLEFSTVAIAVGFSSAIGIFFGIYPARKAARMLPIDALRRE